MATREECVTSVVKAGATEHEAENIVSNIEAYAKSSKSVEETAKKTRERFDNDIRKAILDRKNLLLTVVKRDALDAGFVKAQQEGVSFDEWMTAKMVGSHLNFAGSRDSVSKNFAGMAQNLQANLETKLSSIENARTLLEKDQGFGNLVHREMVSPGSTGDVTAEQVAMVFSEALEDMRQRINRAGGNIGKLDNYAPQSHDGKKLLDATQNQWVSFIGARIDWERSFPDVLDPNEREAILKQTYLTITTGRSATPSARQEGVKLYRPSSMAKSLEQERVFHFKDADAALEYHERFGRGHIGNAVFSSLLRTAKKLALMEGFGPNPELMIQSLVETQAKRIRDVNAEELAHLIGGKKGKALQNKIKKAQKQVDALLLKGQVEEGARLQEALEMELNKARSDASEAVGKLFTGNRKGRIANYYKELTGETSIPHAPTLAKISQGVRNIQSMAKLGGAVLSALSDTMLRIRAMTYTGEGFFTATLKSMPTSKRYKKRERKEIAQGLGVYADGFMREISQRFDLMDGEAGATTRWMDTFFRLSGLNAWTEGHQAAHTYYLSNRLAMNLKKSFTEINKHYAVAFKRHNLSERWKLMRKMVTKADDGNEYVLPENAYSIEEEDLLPFMGEQWQESARPSGKADVDGVLAKIHTKKAQSRLLSLAKLAGLNEDDLMSALGVANMQELSTLNMADVSAFIKGKLDARWEKSRQEAFTSERDRLATDVAGYLVDERQYAVLEPNEKTRAVVRQGTQAGTGAGELLRFIWQFKSFPIVYAQRVLKEGRILRKAGDEKANVPYAVQFAVMSMLFGYAAMSAKDIVKGREPRDPRKMETLIAALLQSGGLGIMGDMFLGTSDRFGNQALASIAGPVLTDATSLLPVLGQASRGEWEGAFDTAAAVALRNTPYINLWWARSSLDYMMLYHIREWMSPGTLKRTERRMKKDFNQEFLNINGFDLTPSRNIKRGGGFR